MLNVMESVFSRIVPIVKLVLQLLTYSFSTMKSKMLVITVFLFTVYGIDVARSENPCSRELHDHKQFMGAKTPYRVRMNPDTNPIVYPGCDAVQLWMIIRHGTRFPSSKVIRSMSTVLPLIRNKILTNHIEGKGSLCADELDAFEKWSVSAKESDQKQLTHEGEDEMQDLGERWLRRLPLLLNEDYNNKSYEFRYTATQRTAVSARQFAVGLFGRYKAAHVWYPEAIAKDPLIRFYKLCTRWKKDVDKNPASLFEKSKFKEGPEMKGVLQRVAEKLGFDTITYGNLHLMYVTCGFETAWFKNVYSPWCAPFAEDDLKVLEYNEDLEYYWIDGYGYEINYKQACPPLKDFMNQFRIIASGDHNQKKGIFYFTHSGALLKLISRLGLYQDEEDLRSDNYDNLKYFNRKWRVSHMDSFGTNLAFLLFRCKEGFKVAGYHQERPFVIPGCDNTLCPLDQVYEKYQDAIHNCQFNRTCSL